MNLRRLLSQAALVTGALLLSAGLQTLAFTAPSTSPPNADAYAPLTTSPTAQSKVGGLLLNTGGATNGLIVQSGNVGIGTASPSQQLDVAGYVKGSGLCIGGDCRTSWPASSAETDPTVISSVKDGVTWDEVSGRPSLGSSIYSCPVRASQNNPYAYSSTWPSCDGQLTTSPTCQYAVEGTGEYQVACSFVGKLVN